MAMLPELKDEPLGIFVWSAYRFLITWVAAKRDVRGELYNGSGIDAAVRQIVSISEKSPESSVIGLSASLMVLLTEMAEDKPNQRKQAVAALSVSEWALRRGFTETALAYAGVVAGLRNSSRQAWLAGRLHRRHARPREADAWYRAADVAATHEKNWDAKARALNSRGKLALDIGRYADARKWFVRAVKFAQRRRLHEREAEAHHHLFAVGVATRDHKLAEQEIARAIDAYGPDHPRLPSFLHDLAAYWMDKGQYENALDLLTLLLERHFKDAPAARLLVLGSAARAAGGAGNAGHFDLLHAELNQLRADGPETFLHGQALLLLARGAVSLGRWPLAKQYATEALESSRRTGQGDTETSAAQLLAEVESAVGASR